MTAASPASNTAVSDAYTNESSAFARPKPRELKHPLTDAQLAQYRELGFVILPGLYNAQEVAAMQAEAQRLYDRTELHDRNNLRMEYDLELNKPWKIDPFVDISETFAHLVRHPRLVDALSSIYDGYAPRLFKDKLIYKPPHSKGSGMHQDYTWWQGFPTSLLSVAIALDFNDEASGCTELFPDPKKGLMTQAGTLQLLPESMVDLTKGVKFVASPGDVAIFNCFAPHRAASNNSERFRRQIFLSFNDSRDGEFYQAHYEHFRWYRTLALSDADAKKAYFR
jgi:2-aminoethylphosphonate dioxygenase